MFFHVLTKNGKVKTSFPSVVVVSSITCWLNMIILIMLGTSTYILKNLIKNCFWFICECFDDLSKVECMTSLSIPKVLQCFLIQYFYDKIFLFSDCTYFSPPATIIFLIFLVFEGLLFGIFTMVMLCTQIKAVISDETVGPSPLKYCFSWWNLYAIVFASMCVNLPPQDRAESFINFLVFFIL